MHDSRLRTMQPNKRSQKEADISQPPLLPREWWPRCRRCWSCGAWKLQSDGEDHMIYTGTICAFGFLYEFRWHCHDCWKRKNLEDKEANKDKDADKDKDTDDKEDKDEEDGPSKKKKPVGTFQPWEDSAPMAVDG